jgi:23S rRNA (pseudouridine1915-N3)-methyltransferase
VGKPRDAHANAMAQEYVKRIGRYARIEMCEVKPGRSAWWTKHAAASKILLDPAGKVHDSASFARIFAGAEREGRDLVFVVGGAEGLPKDWRHQADFLLSLSAMTFPHELARVMLAEQIYRAFTVLRGHPYPR